VLAAYPAPWLLVFDNVLDREFIETFLPPAGNGRVLITTQSTMWPPFQVRVVPVLETEYAAGFLSARTGDPDLEAAVQLAAELGGLPLALEQAAAYIQATGGTLAGYLRFFREGRERLLARGEATGYRKTVATTWDLAFSRLTPAAAGVLRLLAFCAPEAVPLRQLLQPRDGLAAKLGQEVAAVLVPVLDNSLALGDALAELRRFSLVALAGDGLVLVHRLVQAVTLVQMSPDETGQWRQAAAELIEAAIPGDPRLPETWQAFAAVFPHAQTVLDAGSDGMERISRYIGSSGSYAAARDLCLRVFAARESALGAENPATLTARANAAYWTGEAGDPAAARDQFAVLLPVMERVLGPEAPDTLIARGNLGRWTGRAGDADAARDQFAGLLPVAERIFGADHPETLTARGNLARWTGEAGNAAAARDQLERILPIRVQASGPEHSNTLVVLGNIARWTGEAGDPAAARDLLAALLPIRERVSGPEHPSTLTVRGNLARWTGAAGDAAAARDQLAELLPLRKRVLGAGHPDTLTTLADYSRWSMEAADTAAECD
jgi:hypothetical protein